MTEKSLIVFQDQKIRRLLHDNEWFYSVVDIVEVLTDSPTPRQYWGKVKEREFIALELSPIWVQLKTKKAGLLGIYPTVGKQPVRPIFYLYQHLEHLPRFTRDCIKYLCDYIDYLVKFAAGELLQDEKYRTKSLGTNVSKLNLVIPLVFS